MYLLQLRTFCDSCRLNFCRNHLRSTCAACSGLMFNLDDVPAFPEAEHLAECLVDLEAPASPPGPLVAATPLVAPVTPVTPVTPSADSLQFILMQQMQQQLFQLQQQFTTFQVPAPPPDAALQSLMGRSGASRSIIFTSPPSASASSVPFRSVTAVQTRTRMNCKKAGLRLAAETADTSDRPTPITVIPYSIYHSQ